MAYKDRVAVLCAAKCIPNPIQEDNLCIAGLRFYDEDGPLADVEATDMNRAGRLFIEWLATDGFQFSNLRDIIWQSKFNQAISEIFFGELWHDTSETHRPLIHAMKKASRIEVRWKQ